ncbi:hypothetical protein KKF84_00505 [Myxococcota bacterium]|nr:hypothetical protein [Myxococcota bacterium]MBU1533765.1 hypothetical protein [Myxococcota bacterium]
MKQLVLFTALAISLMSLGCRPKKKVFTAKSVSTEFRQDFDKIKELRRDGKLGRAAKLTISLGNRIAKEYPEVMIHREHVLSFMSYAIRISFLCRDKELELKNESTRPEEASEYNKYGSQITDILASLRAKIKTYPWLVPPKPKKVAPPPTAEVKPTDDSTKPADDKGSDTKSDTKKASTAPSKEDKPNKK